MNFTNRSLSLFVMVPFLLLITGCASTGIPKGITAVSDFELDRYLGTWYEIARLDHKFERDLDKVSATYTLNDDGTVRVENKGISKSSGKEKTAVGRAKFVGDQDQAHLKVSFFGPFYGSYVVFELDKDDYQYALVAGPSRKYLWILSRTKTVSNEKFQSLMEIARENGYDTDLLIFVPQ